MAPPKCELLTTGGITNEDISLMLSSVIKQTGKIKEQTVVDEIKKKETELQKRIKKQQNDIDRLVKFSKKRLNDIDKLKKSKKVQVDDPLRQFNEPIQHYRLQVFVYSYRKKEIVHQESLLRNSNRFDGSYTFTENLNDPGKYQVYVLGGFYGKKTTRSWWSKSDVRLHKDKTTRQKITLQQGGFLKLNVFGKESKSD